ncbi:hypothetical protein Moror_1268 [Moniliophthora roreri MCA 2997]|uniref:Uncharacterized protein n=2 Tax=Moniliophthora roreri TaxID=221103 RepID=V2X7J3_MONRO|nr:hypothetical protein Moror_1268 [Moniliophthora roreri MCA 2997]KAI3602814.1 hypothetical protein WG66_008075 [Moniliophthora roreri]
MDPILMALEQSNQQRLEDVQRRIELLLEVGITEREPVRSEKLIKKMQKAASYRTEYWDEKGAMEELMILLRVKMDISEAEACLKTIEKRERLRARLEYLQRIANEKCGSEKSH